MRELTKKQKIKVLDAMIEMVHRGCGLCWFYKSAIRSLKYKEFDGVGWTPRFKELNSKIESEIIRTNGTPYINYGTNAFGCYDDKKWKSGRLRLLRNLRKELLK